MTRAGALVLLVLAAGCRQGPRTPEAAGKGVYAAYDCKRCHRIGAEGGDAGPDLTFAGFRKTPEFMAVWLKDPAAWQPNTLMPNFSLNDEARVQLAAYLGTLKGEAHRGPEGAPWDQPAFKADPLKRGAEIYARAGCVTCHGKGGKGGYTNLNAIGGKVPAVERAKEGFSRAELIKRIADGVRHPTKADPAGPEPMLWMPAWKEALKPDEIEAVADYVLSLAPPVQESW
ncbi:MAG: c-type cytochrome [Elusimicrobia bacterium]|nr:c-type cytochrome [Elusimicrobiota bacterium]